MISEKTIDKRLKLKRLENIIADKYAFISIMVVAAAIILSAALVVRG